MKYVLYALFVLNLIFCVMNLGSLIVALGELNLLKIVTSTIVAGVNFYACVVTSSAISLYEK